MGEKPKITDEEIDTLCERLDSEAKAAGYNLNPDKDFTRGLARGLLINEKRYGYMACPCRLARGEREKDLDIICPCDYRDLDLDDHGACYCALYVTQEVLDGNKDVESIPDRRDWKGDAKKSKAGGGKLKGLDLSYPVWRCKVCGYLCAREGPPQVCPICKAKKDRFERFI